MLSHREFVKRSTGREWVWGVTDFYEAVRVVFGVTGTVVLVGVAILILSAPFAFAWHALQLGRPALIVWSLLAAISWYLARPNFAFIDVLARAACLGVAAFLARSGDNLHLIGGGLIVGLFLLGALTKFAVMQWMQFRLRRSPQAFERLVAAELFVFERRT
jgi:hypothetical protein